MFLCPILQHRSSAKSELARCLLAVESKICIICLQIERKKRNLKLENVKKKREREEKLKKKLDKKKKELLEKKKKLKEKLKKKKKERKRKKKRD